MRSFPQGVSVVTTKFEEKLLGITVSAFTSVSLSPPLVLVSISKNAPIHVAMMQGNYFTVNLLSSNQMAISDRFASRVTDRADKFTGIRFWISSNGCPVLDSSVGFLDCAKYATYDGGDHTLILGEVLDAKVNGDALPLIYHDRKYTTVAPPVAAPSIYESFDPLW